MVRGCPQRKPLARPRGAPLQPTGVRRLAANGLAGLDQVIARPSRGAASNKTVGNGACFSQYPLEGPQLFKSVILIIATALLSLYACSFVAVLHVQQKFFLAVKVLPSCSM